MMNQNRAKPSARPMWPVPLVLAASLVSLILIGLLLVRDPTRDQFASSLVLTTRYSLDQMRAFAALKSQALDYPPSLYGKWMISFNRLLSETEYQFNSDGDDVLVFLHIQKTAGTSFERFLVSHLNITRPCLCKAEKNCGTEKKCRKCRCFRPSSSQQFWLFSRYSTGWVCGLHADFTELFVSRCVERAMDKVEGEHRQRRYFYTTFLRKPVDRFISEYRHVERGATWSKARHVCNGRPPLPHELPWCYEPTSGWANVTLDEFLACPYNLAFNRQARMLADLTLVHCYDQTKMPEAKREDLILESAKNTLRSMAFFGIQDRMAESQELFEATFQMKFTDDLSNWNRSKSDDTIVTPSQLEVINQRNRVDIELFNYATKLFEKRLKMIRDRAIKSSMTL